DGVTGVPYSTSLPATGGATPYTWAMLGGNLPEGLSFSSTGIIQGTPTKAGLFSITVAAADASGASVTASFGITIGTPKLTLSLGSLPSGMVNSPYPAQI